MIITTFNRPNYSLEHTHALVASRYGAPPDILAVQECAQPATDRSFQRWTGLSGKKGFGLAVRHDWTVHDGPLLKSPSARAFVVNNGESDLHVLNVWSHRDPTYLQGVLNALAEAQTFLTAATAIVLGDFNGNPFWDVGNSRFSKVTEFLEGLGLVSAYHHKHGIGHGNEPHPTYFHQWKEDRPYHIDYCFLPPSLLSGAEVTVGSFDDWLGESDHRPLTVTHA